MQANRPPRRPPIVVGMEWASRVTTLGLEVAVPTGLGYWLDLRWGLTPWLTLCGALLGMALFFLDVSKMARQLGRKDSQDDKPAEKS